MLRKILLIALTSGLAAKLYRDACAPRARHAGHDEGPNLKQELHTWEDEGGALPPQATQVH